MKCKPGCIGMLLDIVQRFLDNAKHAELDLGGQPRDKVRTLQAYFDLRALGEILAHTAHGRNQPEIVEDTRSKIVGNPSYLMDRLL